MAKTEKAMMQFYFITMSCVLPGLDTQGDVNVESIDVVLLPDAKAAKELADHLNTLWADNPTDHIRWVEVKEVVHSIIADPQVLIKSVEDRIDEDMECYIGDEEE